MKVWKILFLFVSLAGLQCLQHVDEGGVTREIITVLDFGLDEAYVIRCLAIGALSLGEDKKQKPVIFRLL